LTTFRQLFLLLWLLNLPCHCWFGSRWWWTLETLQTDGVYFTIRETILGSV